MAESLPKYRARCRVGDFGSAGKTDLLSFGTFCSNAGSPRVYARRYRAQPDQLGVYRVGESAARLRTGTGSWRKSPHIPSSSNEDTDQGYVRRITPILHKFWRRSRYPRLFRIPHFRSFRTSLWRTNVYYEQVVCYYEHCNRLINFIYSPVRRIKVRMPSIKVSTSTIYTAFPLFTL